MKLRDVSREARCFTCASCHTFVTPEVYLVLESLKTGEPGTAEANRILNNFEHKLRFTAVQSTASNFASLKRNTRLASLTRIFPESDSQASLHLKRNRFSKRREFFRMVEMEVWNFQHPLVGSRKNQLVGLRKVWLHHRKMVTFCRS